MEAAAAMHSETVAWREDFDLKSVMASYGPLELYCASAASSFWVKCAEVLFFDSVEG